MDLSTFTQMYIPKFETLGSLALLIIISLVLIRFKKSEIREFLNLFKNKKNVIKISISLLILILSIFTMRSLAAYAEAWYAPNTHPLRDFFHDYIPIVNVNFLATFGYLAIIFTLTAYLIIKKPKLIAKYMVTAGLFCLTRGFFISITHLDAPFPRADDHAIGNLFKRHYFTQDLFPSGHTAKPFLAYLFLRKEKIGKFFLIASIVMGVFVLLMHTHYSIDVFGAYFVVFGVFHLSKKYLWKYFELE